MKFDITYTDSDNYCVRCPAMKHESYVHPSGLEKRIRELLFEAQDLEEAYAPETKSSPRGGPLQRRANRRR